MNAIFLHVFLFSVFIFSILVFLCFGLNLFTWLLL